MTIVSKWMPGSALALGFLVFAIALRAQERPSRPEVVYGRCAVEAQGWRDNFGQCRLTGTDGGIVPAGRTLVIEHVSAVCTGPVEHPITLLALATQLRPEQDLLTQIVVPLTRRELITQGGSLYQASFATRLYAGPGTRVELYLSLESGFVPTTAASCGLMFHGRLVPAR